MTVRVTDPEPQKEALKEIVCMNCGVKLSYVRNDVKERHGIDYGGGPDGAEWINCANCREPVYIKRW